MAHIEEDTSTPPNTVSELADRLHPALHPIESVTTLSLSCRSPYRLAGVLIPVIETNDTKATRTTTLSMVFVQRATGLPQHSGEVAFPGGAFKTVTDKTIKDTALRETEEEIGVHLNQVQVLGAMKPLRSISNFCIIPLLGAVTPPYTFTPDHHEIQEIFTVPLAFLLSPKNHQIVTRTFNGHDHRLHYFNYQKFTIWGVTGELVYRVLHQLDPANFPITSTYP